MRLVSSIYTIDWLGQLSHRTSYPQKVAGNTNIQRVMANSSPEVINPMKRPTVVTEVTAREIRTLEYRTVRQQRDIIKHFSHPHALREHEFHERYRIVCDACILRISGEAYGCAKCDFYLHKSCFEAPRELEHGGHPQHTLKLLSKTTYPSNYGATCNGCGKETKGFRYRCEFCNYNLHLDCAHLPKVMNRDDHQHTLTLYYSLPYYNYSYYSFSGEEYCAVCRYAIDKRRWVYGCYQCKYWCHSDCVFGEATSTWADVGRNIGGAIGGVAGGVVGGVTDGVVGVTGGILSITGGIVGGLTGGLIGG
ncbi:hypothetical protein Ancab_025420 [Ancistrocladus abbreviatus]